MKTVSEIVGLLALVGSLIFVGLEVRQNAEATRAATAHSLSEGWLQWNLAMSTPEAWSAVIRMFEVSDYSDASPADREAVASLLRSLFGHWSNLHYQYLRGNLDPALWEGTYRNLERNFTAEDWGDLVQWGWTRSKHIYHRDFQQLVDRVLIASTQK